MWGNIQWWVMCLFDAVSDKLTMCLNTNSRLELQFDKHRC